MRCELCFFNTRTMLNTLVTPFKSIPHSSIRRYATVSSVAVSFWSINSTSWGAQIPLIAQKPNRKSLIPTSRFSLLIAVLSYLEKQIHQNNDKVAAADPLPESPVYNSSIAAVILS